MSIQHHADPISSKRPQSLTPQRKHRKLLKDGTGGEVWPEHIEQLFVQGLRAYWQSPWATYSRGRSRWRNQFLVDYLEKAGVTRTKKQVASHIQVLRNMWKTESELQLVGTGEELFQDSGLLAAVKREELGCLDFDDSMSSGSSPSFSPGDFPSEVLPSPTQNHSPMFKAEAYSPNTMLAFPTQSVCSSPSSSNWESSGLPTSPPTSGAFPLPSTATAQPLHSKYSPSRVDPSTRPASRSATFPSAQAQYVSSNSNRPTTFTLRAEGMTPLVINLDALFPTRSRRTALALRIRLSVPPTDDLRSSPQLYGFGASLSLASVWQLSARCTTRAFYTNSCVSESTSALDPTLIQGGTAHANLPESPLTQCRMFDPSIQTSLSQEIVVDNEPMLYVLYELERRTHIGLPSAELLGCQEFPMQKSGRSTPRSTSTPSPYAHYSRHPQQAFMNATAPTTFMTS